MVMNEQPSRQRIITHLKKAEWLTVAELSKKVGITPMAIRQHLMALERQGIIRYVVKKTGIGRPVFLYRLTEEAEKIFPKAYGQFISDILRAVEELDGKKKIDRIFKLRNEYLLTERRNELNSSTDISEKINSLADILNRDGYMVDLESTDEGIKLKQFNCPISEVANNFQEACKYELELYKDLLGDNIIRDQCQRDGDTSCTYFIPHNTV